MTEPNLYDAGFKDGVNIGYDVGFEHGFKKAQARVLDDLGDDPEIMAASRAEWAARAKAAEAKLAKAVEALQTIASDMSEPRDDDSAYITCISILSELTGGKDG